MGVLPPVLGVGVVLEALSHLLLRVFLADLAAFLSLSLGDDTLVFLSFL